MTIIGITQYDVNKYIELEKKIPINIYYLAFRYKRDVNVVKVTANQLANELLGQTDDIFDLKWGNEHKDDEFGISDQGFTRHLWFDGKDYVIEFADDRHFFNIYEYVKDEEDSTKWYGENKVAEKCAKHTDSGKNNRQHSLLLPEVCGHDNAVAVGNGRERNIRND